MSAADPRARNQRRARTMITPEGLAIPITIASRGSRFGALLIDLMILIGALILVNLLINFIGSELGFEVGIEDASEESSVAEFLFVLGIIFGFFAWYGYFLVQELGPRGATLGKRILGIRVAARAGGGGDGRLTAEAVIARTLLRDVEVFYPIIYMLVALVLSLIDQDGGMLIWAVLAWFFLFALFPFFNRDALRAGDIVAGTWVVEAPRVKLAEAISTQGAAARAGASEVTGTRYQFGEAELSVYGIHELQTLERLLREGDDKALIAVHATICRKIGWDPGAGDERAFLEAFYAQLRARLETGMRFGTRKADKYS